MALSKYQMDQQAVDTDAGSAAEMRTPTQAAPVIELTETQPHTFVARYNPQLGIHDYGWRGRWRAMQIFWTFGLYHLFLYVYHRGWFIGEKGESEEKHLQWQAEWLSRQLLRLGPTFIKIGQAVATRADLLPLAYIKELSKLQDSVPSFPREIAFGIIEEELGKPISELYAEIEPEPIAAASLGQVYRARLHSGETVAVKVQRPALAEVINFDLAVLHRIAQFMKRFPSMNRGVDWNGTIDEFAAVIFEELNYHQEGRNAEKFRDSFSKWREVHVPKIYWTRSSHRVLTMEFINGTKLLDLEGLRARGIDPPDVVRLVARTYLKQLLEDGFFHADPHPGNLRLMDDGRLAFFDFGMVGRITPELQGLMIDAFFHILERDVRGLTQDLIRLEFLPEDMDFEVIRPVVEKIFNDYLTLKLGEVRFKDLTYEMADIMYQYPFRLPPNFTYIIRAIMTLEGMAIVMYPGFSFFEIAKPYAREFMLRREGKHFRDALIRKLIYGEDSQIQWDKAWKLAKMAFKSYFGNWFSKPSEPDSTR
jgi:predicted unusual protein kinase regulating ubiquinone biosynthesis (AarF/ABC1/UbiB family)